MTHGTRQSYQQGPCRCLPCRAANAAYQSQYRRLKAKGRQPLGAKVSAAGAWRKIMDLKGDFETRTQLAHHLGWKDRHIQLDRRTITLRNWLKIRRFYFAAIDGQAYKREMAKAVVSPVTESQP